MGVGDEFLIGNYIHAVISESAAKKEYMLYKVISFSVAICIKNKDSLRTT